MTGLSTGPHIVVAHARRVPVGDRERLGERLAQEHVPGVLVRTCHRVELYTWDEQAIEAFAGDRPAGTELLRGESAARHVVEVAVGLDSAVIGEDQILHQLRTATAVARRTGLLDPALDRLMNVALRAGRRARSWRPGPKRSLADAAVEAIEQRIGHVAGRRVLVVGAGEMGRLSVLRAQRNQANVSVVSRTAAHAAALAAATGADRLAFDPGSSLDGVAAVIVALRGKWEIGPESIARLLAGRPTVVDLSVPGALPDAVIAGLGQHFISVDDLATLQLLDASPFDIAATRALVEEAMTEFQGWLEGRAGRLAASTLVDRAEIERKAELEHLWRDLPALDIQARAAIEQMSQHLVGRILREPLERLGRDEDGRSEAAARELFAL